MPARENSLFRQSLSMTVFGIVWISSIFIGSAFGQDFKRPDGSVPLPLDWSDQHVIYTVGFTGEQAEKMQGDPRYFAAVRLHGKALADESAANGYPIFMRTGPREFPVNPAWRPPPEFPRGSQLEPRLGSQPQPRWESPPEPPWESPIKLRRAVSGMNELKTDWSVSLGPTAGVAAGQFPAKFTFDVNAAPNCTNDYVVFPVNATTNFTRTNVTGTFSTTAGGASGNTVTFTVTPTGGSSVMLTLTSSLTVNTGLNFQVFASGSTAHATTEALNLALAINRNLSATSGGGGLAATASGATVTVYTVRAGTQVTLTTSENLTNFSFGGVTAGTTGNQANLVGFNNLYSGSGSPFCSGKTFPTFIFSYASGYGPVSTSPVISLDGTKIAYIENGPALGAVLHVLKFATGSTEYGNCTVGGTAAPTCATAPVVPSNGTSTATAVAIPFLSALATAATPSATAVPATISAPFVNYTTDTLFVGDDNGNLYSVTGVFQGTPALAGGNFPVAVSSGNVLNSPVVDASGTGNIFIGDSASNVFGYSSAGVLLGSKSIGNGTNRGIWDGAIVDSTNGMVYFTTNCSGSGGNSALSQIPFTNTSLGTVITSVDTQGQGCAAGSAPQYAPTPDNLYYTAGISNGHILVSYQGTGSIRLAEWGFMSNGALNTTRLQDSNFYVGASVGSSPSTEFYGSAVAYTPTALTQSGTTVTVTTGSNKFVTNQVVTIAGVAAHTGGCTAAAVAAINGEQTVTVVNATTFTFISTVTATINSGNCTLTGSSATGSTQDYIFFGSGQPAVYQFTLPMVANQNPAVTNTTSVTGPGGNGAASATSGIIVDNNSTSGQAASLYFGTQATSTSICGSTAAYCAVKLTQVGLQ